jgi:hypothetical protein
MSKISNLLAVRRYISAVKVIKNTVVIIGIVYFKTN